MTRVLLLCPETTDADVAGHLAALRSLPGVAARVVLAPGQNRLSYILRGAAGLFRERRTCDVVVSVGEAALAAANVGWRGPLVHLPEGTPTPAERSLLRGRAARGDLRVVTTSGGSARRAARTIADARHVRLIRPAPSPPTMTRDQARARLGLSPDQPLVYVPGHARRGSGHRLALWSVGILAFRDPRVRLLLKAGGPADAFVGRFMRSTGHARAVIGDAALNDADRALAADVAVCTADGAPEWTALRALRDAGTPLVMTRAAWERERLTDLPATLVEEPKPRLIARAALDAIDGGRLPVTGAVTSSHAAEEWALLLDAIAAPGRVADRH